MAKTYNRLEIDVNKKPNSIGIRPVQNDTKSRYLDVCLYENGVPINLTGEQVRITFRKADGSTFFNQGEVTDATAGRCQFALTNEILSEAKAVESQISVWNAGGQILSTQVFEIYVTAAIPWTDAVESENEYGVLVVLFQEIQDALDTMHKIAAAFGEPGEKAAEYGVDTFWGILETLAGRGDVESALEKKIKAYLNSTIGTSGFQSLDKMLPAKSGTQTFTENGTFTVPDGVTKIWITAFGAGAGGNHSGGQGGARIIKKAYSVTPQTSIQITIGIGGTAGNDGGATVIGNLVTLEGGGSKQFKKHNGALGGRYGARADAYSENGQDSPESYGGKGGYNRSSTGGDVYSGGGGGGAGFGRGGDGGDGDYSSNAGKDGGIGAGGGGGGQRASSGDGGNGIVIIEW